RRKFQSARLKAGEYDEKPWLQGKEDPNYRRKKIERGIFWGSIALGVVLGAAICAFEYINVSTGEFCLFLEDDFHTIDPATWSYEIQRGGFGSGSFEWTTTDAKNAYTDAEGLHIVPTLTTETTDITPAQILDGYVLNLTTAGTCTSQDYTMCSIRSNSTSGDIVNPVRSARLSTQGKKTLKYGRVEVTAKMPQGDWLWPAIWMMPEDSVYGPWPQSGEIDIAESKGNSPVNYTDGRDSVGSTLHWGPTPGTDAFWRTSGKHTLKRTDYSEAFHVYGLEWTEKYLFMYIDSRLLQVFFLKFNSASSMWNRGKFGETIVNKSALADPWTSSSAPNTPFDQSFFLILNVAVGGTNGYFVDGVGNKPWGDAALTAPLEFWKAKDVWLPTWGEGDKRGMTVQSVKMYKEGKC
ncbi:glycoside hydrolase family 16 protein, partial [Baudoinia panamericana UAMH 10762]